MSITEATIDERGEVSAVYVMQGAQPLADAAVAAVRQWRFTPPPAQTTLGCTVSFMLREQPRPARLKARAASNPGRDRGRSPYAAVTG